MDLENKAQWHKDINGGMIPLLESPDGKIVFESAVIMDFATGFAKPDQGLKLWPHEAAPAGDVAAAMKTAQMKLDMQAFDKLTNQFWGPFLGKFADQEKLQVFATTQLPQWEALIIKLLNGKEFLSGTSEPMMIDFHFLPMVERIVMLENSRTTWKAAFETMDIKNKCPTMYAYNNRASKHAKLAPYIMQQDHYNLLLEKFDNMEGKPMLDHKMIGKA